MRAAIYVRKSRLSEKGESINNQIDLCKKYCERINVDNPVTDFVIYQDEGFSGGNINRPQFKKLMNDVKKRRFDYLVCYKLDRISRNVADFSATLRTLEDNNVNFVSITEQFDTSSVMGRAMINISATFAQMERETIAERIKDNMLELSKTGRWLGGTCPLGFKSVAVEYESNGHKKKMYELEIVPEEIEIVKIIYSMYLNKKSCSPVARYLCTNSIKGKNGGDFSRNTVLQILINPVYCVADNVSLEYFKSKGATITSEPNLNKGLMAYNKRKNGKVDNPMSEWIVSTGGHTGVISSVDWVKCQSILEEVKGRTSNRQGTGKKFLLSGMLKCEHCGSSMASWSKKSRDGKYEKYYRCELKNRASNRCICKMLNAYVADDFVITLLKDFDISSIEDLKTLDTSALDSKNVEREKSSLTKALNYNNKMLTGLIRKLALIDDIEILSMIQKEIKQIKADNEYLDKSINELSLKTFNIEDETENKLAFIESFNIFKNTIDFVNDVELKRNMIKTIVKEFSYNSLTKEIKFKIRL